MVACSDLREGEGVVGSWEDDVWEVAGGLLCGHFWHRIFIYVEVMGN